MRRSVFPLVAILGSVGILASSAVARAQGVPGSVSFTARLAEGGAPITGTRSFDLKLFDAETGGTQVWTETHNGVMVQDGLAFLSMGGQSSMLDAFTLDGSPRWLQISVNGTIMAPRLPVESVPYAIRAGTATNAETLEGLSATDFVTGVTVGPGLSGGGSSGDVLLSADTAYVQRRVGPCGAGNAIQVIAVDGTPTCIPVGSGDITGVTVMPGSGLTGGAAMGDAPLALVSCMPGDILKFTTAGWVCALDDDAGGDITAINTPAGSGLTGTTSTGDASLALISCAAGDTLIYGASGWGCGTAGDIGGVTTAAGSGLTGGVASGTANLSLTACAINQVLRYTGPSTGWQCSFVDAMNPPSVMYDTGWFAAPMRSQISLPHSVSTYDFAFGMARGRDETGAEVLAPIMAAEHPTFSPAYNELSTTAIGFQPWDALFSLNNPGDRNNLHIIDGEIRLRLFDVPASVPQWDSGWQPCAAGNTYTYLHTLGAMPTYAHMEIAQNSDGSGWRVPTMGANTSDGVAYRQTSIVTLTATQVTYRTQSYLANFFRNGAQPVPTTGYCRVRLFNWTPDYDSGWVSISTTAANRDKLFVHNFGQVPSLVNVYIAQNSDGSGWLVVGLGQHRYNYANSAGIYHLSENFALIKGGAGCQAQFVDSSGAGICPTSGYVRFMAWR